MQMTYQEFKRRKALGIAGLINSSISPEQQADRMMFINDINENNKNKIREYNVWYSGDSDELMNFYTQHNAVGYNVDPLYNRNKKSYYWSVSSTEDDIKRTHSGQPRNVVDTLVNIISVPQLGVGSDNGILSDVSETLNKILEENNFTFKLQQYARPLTLVEGWGARKINWDSDFSDSPILIYYRADAVDFVYRYDKLVAIIYKDFYQNEKGRDFTLFETRRLAKVTCTDSRLECYGKKVLSLIIEKELFENVGNDQLKECELTDLPQLKDVEKKIIIYDYDSFLGAPSIYFADNNEDLYGRSIFTGKIDMFDDLDQCLSQASNAVRKSTPVEYLDELYLEKDRRTGLSIMPKVFDRKYVKYRSPAMGDGATGSHPITSTQPNFNIEQYDTHAVQLLLNIISGVMSPATLGIDIAKKDNAEAQREKEKVTIFTRNTIIEEEKKIYKRLCNDLLFANELMHSPDGTATCKKYSVFAYYKTFADDSFENKLEVVLSGWQAGIFSDEYALKMLHGDSLSAEAFKTELEFVKKKREENEQRAKEEEEEAMYGIEGADGGGYNDTVRKNFIENPEDNEINDDENEN